MSASLQRLLKDFGDREYRQAYAEGFLNSWIATQLATIRRQRGLTQQDLAALVGTKQPGIARMERDDYGRWNLITLQNIAFELGCRLRVSFETFGTLIEEIAEFKEDSLRRPSFDQDPVFSAPRPDGAGGPIAELRHKVAVWIAAGGSLDTLATWLLGYDLPPVGNEVTPYEWLLDAVSEDSASRTALAERISAGIVRREWDIDPPNGRRDFVENLFSTAEGLRLPYALGDALLTALTRRQHSPLASTGMYPGHPLARAILVNQPDGRFRDFWTTKFLDERSLLQMPEFSAYGLVGMSNMGMAPNVAAIVDAVRGMQQWSVDRSVRVTLVEHALQSVWATFPECRTLPMDVLELAAIGSKGWSRSTIVAWRRSLPLDTVISDSLLPLFENTMILTDAAAAVV